MQSYRRQEQIYSDYATMCRDNYLGAVLHSQTIKMVVLVKAILTIVL